MDILQYINKMNRLYGNDTQVAKQIPQFGTQETYGAPEKVPMPNIQDLMREEGVQIGEQVKAPTRYNTMQYLQGGRVGMKPGGLVEKGVGKGRIGIMRRDPSAEWLKFSQDPKFKEFFTQQIKMASDKAETKALKDLKKVMNKYKLTAKSPAQDIFEKFVVEHHNALSQVKDSFISGRSYHTIFSEKFDTFKRNYGTMSVREFTEALPAMKGYANPVKHFTRHRISSKTTDDSLAKMDPSSSGYRSKISHQRQGKIFMQALQDHGIEVIEHPAKAKYRGKFPGEKRYVGEVRIKATPEQLVSFNDSKYWEDVYKTSKDYKAKITKLSKADPMYKLGGYGEHLGNLTKLQKNLNNVIDSKTFEELVKWVDENPKLKDMVEAHFNRSTLEMEKRPLREMSEGELRQRVRFERDHIRGRGTVGYDKVSNKILDGIGVEFPKNYHIIPGSINFPTKFNVESAVRDFPDKTEKIKKLEDWFKKRDISFWDQNTGTYRGAVPKEVSAYTSHLGIDMEKLLKSEEVFPEWHKRAGHPIVEDPKLLGKITKANSLIEKLGCPGLAAGGRASFQDGSTCYSRGVEKIKTGEIKTPAEKSNFSKLAKVTGGLKKLGSFLFGPVEMGTLPLFIAAEGLYTNYANKRDLKKALDRVPISKVPQYQKDLILEGYRQEARDIGGVGLETYAIDKPNISGALEKIGLGDKKQMMDFSGGLISGIREVEAAEEAERYRKLYPEAQKEKFDVSKPMFKSGGKVGYDNYLPNVIDDDK